MAGVRSTVSEDVSVQGFGEVVGFRTEWLDNGKAEVSLELMDHHRNFFGIVHGGVILAMLDQTCGTALRSLRDDDGPQGSVTVDLQTVFVGAARGARLVGKGTCLRKGRSIAQCTASIEDEDGTLVATAIGTFKVMR